MKKNMECAYCDGIAELKTEKKEIEFRKEKFAIHQLFYRCLKCGEEFTTNEVDLLTTEQIYNQYREKHKIPFPEEVIAIREKYQLPATKMSQVLGLGVNSYSNFEKGEVPSISIGNLIRTASQPKIFKDLLINAKDYFSENNFEKTLGHLDFLINKDENIDIRSSEWIFSSKYYRAPNSFNGYKMLDIDKISNLVIYFLSNCDSHFNDKLKLNKLFFFTDFLNYQKCVRSVTGIAYKAIPHGPTPSNHDCIYEVLKDEKLIGSKIVPTTNGNAIELFESKESYNWEIFSETERETITYITKMFGKLSSWQVHELSNHYVRNELNEKGELISYQDHAFDLDQPLSFIE